MFVCGRTWVLGLVWLIKLIMKLVGVVAEKVVGVLAVVGNVGVVVDAPKPDHNTHNNRESLLTTSHPHLPQHHIEDLSSIF